MDAEQKKKRKAQVRNQQRKAALAALPLPVAELKALFDMLDAELPVKGCDHTRRLTQAWLETLGHPVESVFAWLDTQSSYCDCEILANVEERVNDATKADS